MLRGLLAAALTGEARQAAKRARRAALLLALAAAALAIAVGFLIAAAYMLAARRFGGIEAAIGFGVGFFALGAICILANMIAAEKARQRRKIERGPELRGLAVAAALTALPSLLRSRATLPLLVVPAIGLIALKIFSENRKPRMDDDD